MSRNDLSASFGVVGKRPKQYSLTVNPHPPIHLKPGRTNKRKEHPSLASVQRTLSSARTRSPARALMIHPCSTVSPSENSPGRPFGGSGQMSILYIPRVRRSRPFLTSVRISRPHRDPSPHPRTPPHLPTPETYQTGGALISCRIRTHTRGERAGRTDLNFHKHEARGFRTGRSWVEDSFSNSLPLEARTLFAHKYLSPESITCTDFSSFMLGSNASNETFTLAVVGMKCQGVITSPRARN